MTAGTRTAVAIKAQSPLYRGAVRRAERGGRSGGSAAGGRHIGIRSELAVLIEGDHQQRRVPASGPAELTRLVNPTHSRQPLDDAVRTPAVARASSPEPMMRARPAVHIRSRWP